MAKNSYENKNIQWWNSSDLNKASSMWSMVEYLSNTQHERIENNALYMRLYANNPTASGSMYQYGSTYGYGYGQNRISYNLTAMVIDALVSKIGKNTPKVTFLTSQGNWSDKSKAQKLERYILGQFLHNGYYRLGQRAFKDCLIEDLGVVKHYVDGDKIVSERILPNELYVDYTDTLYSKPRHIYHIKHVAKDWLKAQYPDAKLLIDSSASNLGNSRFNMPQSAADDFVLVVEGWRLPTEQGPGEHTIATSNALLFSEEWEHDWLPFTFMRWNERQIGFYGQSLAEELVPLQVEINKLMRDIQKSYNMMLAPKVFIPNGAKIPESHIDNDIGTIIKGSAEPKVIFNGQIFPAEAYNHLKWLINSGFERAGITQLSATGKKPAGLDAAVAMREYQDIETERFASVQQMYEQFYIDTAKIYIELSKQMSNPVVRFSDSRYSEEIHFNDINLEEDKYVIRLWPTNMLPETPAGQVQMLKELMDLGVADVNTATALLDFPDLNGAIRRKTAAYNYFNKLIEVMMEKGEYEAPDPSMPLDLGMQLFQQAYDEYKLYKAPEERLELLRTWLASARKLMEKAMEASRQAVPQQQGAPEAGQQLNEQGVPVAPLQG